MFSLKHILLMAACLILTASASPIELVNLYEYEPEVIADYARQVRSLQDDNLDLALYDNGYEPVLTRQARSPQHGSFGVNASKGPYGREASATYNHNLYTSSDGRGSIDAYAQASRNFDYNRNNFGGGIMGSWRF